MSESHITISNLLNNQGRFAEEIHDSDLVLVCNKCCTALKASQCLVSGGYITTYFCPKCQNPLVTIVALMESSWNEAPGIQFDGYILQTVVQLRIGNTVIPSCRPLFSRR